MLIHSLPCSFVWRHGRTCLISRYVASHKPGSKSTKTLVRSATNLTLARNQPIFEACSMEHHKTRDTSFFASVLGKCRHKETQTSLVYYHRFSSLLSFAHNTGCERGGKGFAHGTRRTKAVAEGMILRSRSNQRKQRRKFRSTKGRLDLDTTRGSGSPLHCTPFQGWVSVMLCDLHLLATSRFRTREMGN
jgi:hypothetical protein